MKWERKWSLKLEKQLLALKQQFKIQMQNPAPHMEVSVPPCSLPPLPSRMLGGYSGEGESVNHTVPPMGDTCAFQGVAAVSKAKKLDTMCTPRFSSSTCLPGCWHQTHSGRRLKQLLGISLAQEKNKNTDIRNSLTKQPSRSLCGCRANKFHSQTFQSDF